MNTLCTETCVLAKKKQTQKWHVFSIKLAQNLECIIYIVQLNLSKIQCDLKDEIYWVRQCEKVKSWGQKIGS